MSISEKLLIIAENVPKVYEAGQKAGGDYNTAYNEGYGKGYTEGEMAGYKSGYADGQSDTPNLLEYATNISNLYYGARFPANTEMTIIVPSATNINFLFYNSLGLTKATIKGISDNRKIESQQVFRESTNLEIIDLSDCLVKLGNAYQMFYKCTALTQIKGELDFSECTNVNNTFVQCRALVEVRIKVNSLSLSISFVNSSNLSADSVQSIIVGLADLTGLDAQTITFHSSIVLTDEQKATISNKNWTLVQ